MTTISITRALDLVVEPRTHGLFSMKGLDLANRLTWADYHHAETTGVPSEHHRRVLVGMMREYADAPAFLDDALAAARRRAEQAKTSFADAQALADGVADDTPLLLAAGAGASMNRALGHRAETDRDVVTVLFMVAVRDALREALSTHTAVTGAQLDLLALSGITDTGLAARLVEEVAS